MKSVRERLSSVNLDRPSPLLKQTATAGAFLIALLLLPSMGAVVHTAPALLVLGIVGVGLATLTAGLFTAIGTVGRWVVVIPIIDVLALGAFREGTGGSASPFASLMLLPVVWIASKRGRWNIALAAGPALVALLLPSLFIPGATRSGQQTTDLVRAFFTPFVWALASAVINELARQARAQLGAAQALSVEQERSLDTATEHAERLAASEARLREAENTYRGLWSAVTEQSVIGTDETGLVDAWNPGAAKLFGLQREETEGKRFVTDFHVPDQLEEHAQALHYPPGATVLNPGFSALVETARLGSAENREWDYVRSDGSRVPVSLSVTARLDEHGEIVGYLFIGHDVTKEREVARLKDEFVGLISHELRTPLSSILGYLELMRDEDENPLSPEQLQYLGVAERNAHRLLRLVGDLLFTAQVESGKFPLEVVDVDLPAVVRAAVESAGPTAAKNGVALVEEITDASLAVRGDPVRLGQSVDNLLSNALKFTPHGGTVTVGLRRDGTWAVVTVADTGLGIAESELDQLFARFFRATTATRNAVPGVGLGLTITKAIVTAHAGHMDVESQEGVGTTFSMSLPLAEPDRR